MLLRKQITGYVIVLLMAAPIFIGASFLIKQHLIQNNMKEMLEKTALQTLSLPTATIKWSRPGKEIWLGNQLFDIKSILIIGEATLVTGLFDKDESNINNLITSFTEQHQPNSNSTSLLQWVFFPVFSNPSFYSNASPDWVFKAKQYSPLMEQLPSSPFCNIFLPPKI